MPPLMGLLCGIMYNKPHSQAGIHRRTVSTAMADVLTQTHEYMNMPRQAEQHKHTPMHWHRLKNVEKGFEDPTHCRTANSCICGCIQHNAHCSQLCQECSPNRATGTA